MSWKKQFESDWRQGERAETFTQLLILFNKVFLKKRYLKDNVGE